MIGDDLKTGQTKLKSVMAEFLISTALKPTSIVSYNHLGNNDGLNLSSEEQFKSKEISKASVVEDMVTSNKILYPKESDHPDHLIVIKYVKSVGDSKRALDEYSSDIFMNGQQTIVIHNTCEDSLLAVPIMMDLILFSELFGRITVADGTGNPAPFHPLLSSLSLFVKAPQVPSHAPVVNGLFQQREALLDLLKVVAGFTPTDHISMVGICTECAASKYVSSCSVCVCTYICIYRYACRIHISGYVQIHVLIDLYVHASVCMMLAEMFIRLDVCMYVCKYSVCTLFIHAYTKSVYIYIYSILPSNFYFSISATQTRWYRG